MHYFAMIAVLILAAIQTPPIAHHDDEKLAVEAAVRAYEQDLQEYDFDKANSLLTPDARWIEDSYPEPAVILPNSSGRVARVEAKVLLYEEGSAARQRPNRTGNSLCASSCAPANRSYAQLYFDKAEWSRSARSSQEG